MKLCAAHSQTFQLCLPESFEWLILKSGIVQAPQLSEILEQPSLYIESAEYFSWENFFESYLVRHTQETPFQYAKHSLSSVYLQANNRARIAEEILD